MGNMSSECVVLEWYGGYKMFWRDSLGGIKDGDRFKILMDSFEDVDFFYFEEIKVLEKEEFLVWQYDLEVNDKVFVQVWLIVF